jgi:hypothetical protein
MASIVYFLCALTALACFVFLLRGWIASGSRLLFWSALCFGFMTANNVLLVIDKVYVLNADLSTWRLVTAFTAVSLLVFGLVWEED